MRLTAISSKALHSIGLQADASIAAASCGNNSVLACRQMGATAVLLTPVVMTDAGDGPMGQAPMSFFAPNPALAVGQSPLAPSQELKHVIRELHAQGIEVILQVRFHIAACHAAQRSASAV